MWELRVVQCVPLRKPKTIYQELLIGFCEKGTLLPTTYHPLSPEHLVWVDGQCKALQEVLGGEGIAHNKSSFEFY